MHELDQRKLMTEQIQDLSVIDADKHTAEEWRTLIRAKDGDDTVIVSNSVAWYFFEVLPPRWLPGAGVFAYCEGNGRYTVFVSVDGIWLMRTLPYGERAPDVLGSRAREMRAYFEMHRTVP